MGTTVQLTGKNESLIYLRILLVHMENVEIKCPVNDGDKRPKTVK